MARYTGPKHRLCRREGVAICGSPNCPVIKKNAGPPGQQGVKGRRKISEYGMQLREKQKAKRIYGVLEKQFSNYYKMAASQKAATGTVLLQLLETRLDNTVYRLNLAQTRTQARQLVSHGHIMVNNKVVTTPSYHVKIADVISFSTKAASFNFIQKLAQDTKDAKLPSWLDKKGLVGKIVSMPNSQELDANINERLIVEYYSR